MKSKLKIYTSYVNKDTLLNFIEQGYLPIFILRKIYNSDIIGKYTDTAIHIKNLAPSNSLFQERRDCNLDLETYKKRYAIELSKTVDFEQLITKLEALAKISNSRGIILMGYDKNPDNCHRSVLAEILNHSNLLEYEIDEI